jgi:hypothetical protein
MHQKDILVVRIGVAVAPVAQKHHLTAGELLKYLTRLFPAIESRLLKRAASIGAAQVAA